MSINMTRHKQILVYSFNEKLLRKKKKKEPTVTFKDIEESLRHYL